MDLTIHEDELEHDRILLEQNLQMQHTEASFRLSSPGGDHDESDELEYARHGSLPSPEFNFRDRNRHTDEDGTRSHIHMWSYRTAEDDEGVNPYSGESMSTAGHHASAVTLTAGLAGARSRRGADASHSGAEYDPDRPIGAMIAGVEKLSMFDTTDPSKSKYSNTTFDPLIVDSTAELDRVLQSGHQPPPSLRSRDKSGSHSRSVRLRSPHPSSISSDNENSQSNVDDNRPKLSDALRRVSFSPQRPRSPHSMPRASSSQSPKNNASGHTRQPSSPLARVDAPVLHDEADAPTPRPARRAAFIPSDQASHPRSSSAGASNQPQVRLHPATPSTSSLPKSVRGKAGNSKRESSRSHRNHEEETVYNRAQEDVARPSSASLLSRHVPNHRQATPLRKSSLKVPAGTPRFGKVQLPDVTGLTNAVESPAKMGLGDEEYMSMAGLRVDDTAAREVEARLIKTLNAVQYRIEHLEEENSISRRRVRELEYELEECKRDVVRERTKLLEETAELSGVIHAATIARALGKRSTKGKGKAKESHAIATAVNLSAAEERYREVVEEKKALEALISSLRSHLARLTSELSEHQAILMELRSLREKDAIALREKLAEVDNLRNEVERLAGEVEVLRGVVEEGLRERRRSGRDVSVDASVGPEDRGMSVDENDESVDQAESRVDTEEEEINASDLEDSRPDNLTNTVTNDDDPWSIDGSSRANTTTNPVNNDNDGHGGFPRAMRTDRASLGSSVPPLGLSTVSNGSALTTRTNAARANTSVGEGNSFVGEDEKSRIEAEIEERRSMHGSFDASGLSPSPRPRLNSPTLRRGITQRRTTGEDASGDEEAILGHETRTRPAPGTPPPHSEIPPRAPAPTPFHATVGADGSPRREVDDRSPRSCRTSDEPRRTNGKDGCEFAETPFPRIRGEYLERLFFSAPEHDARTCRACTRRRRPANAHALREGEYNREYEHCAGDGTAEGEDDDDTIGQLLPSRYDRFLKARNGKRKQGVRDTQRQPSGSGARRDEVDDEGFADASSEEGPATVQNGVGARDKGKQRAAQFVEAKKAGESGLPPQTVATRVIRELEDDFTHYKSVYCELADRYKEMDAVSEVRRRNILAKHLKEVVDILEQKGDQIAALYDLLSFKDKPLSQRGWSRRP
ncbi:hypothetical protein JOM56_010427 [Amanita muscaria]